jgi:hypothetical protein
MKMLVQFDIDADIIDVPQSVIDSRDGLRTKFLHWLHDRNNKHKYWVKLKDRQHGGYIWGLCFRSDAFVEWLNKKTLRDSSQKAVIVDEHVCIDDMPDDMPYIFF